MKINSNSSHYKMVSWFRDAWEIMEMDSCAYIRAVIWSFILTVILTVATSFMAIILVESPIVWAIFLVLNGYVDPHPEVVVGFVLWIVAAGIYLAHYIDTHDLGIRIPKIPEDSFIKQAKDRWKNKYCSKLEIS